MKKVLCHLSTVLFVIIGIFLASACVNIDDSVRVTDITLNQLMLTLTQGETGTITATVSPSNATNKDVLWITGNAKIATVDNGVVTAIGVGETTITAKSDDGGFIATCEVLVIAKNIPVTGVSLDKENIALSEGEESTLIATLTPADATNGTLQWSSSNTTVATVDGTGKISAMSKGSATITVMTTDGEFSAQCYVTVAPRVRGVKLNKNSISLAIGESETLVATVSPSDALNKDVDWSSDNASVATVDNNGRVTAVGTGSTTIKALTKDNGYFALCTVIVRIGVTSVKLDPTSMVMMPGEEKAITATVSPDNATNRNVSWTSSDEGVAKYFNGKVLAIAEGTATITATSEDGGFTSTCKITVTNDITRFVTAKYLGGSQMINNGLILYGSTLNFGVYNNSSKQITVKSVQLIDGVDGSSTNVMSINETMAASSNVAWSISVPLRGIHSPTAKFVCTCEGKEFSVSATYVEFNF